MTGGRLVAVEADRAACRNARANLSGHQGAVVECGTTDRVLRTMYDVRNNLSNDVSAQLHKHFGDKLLRSIIPRNIRLAEAPSHGKPINLYDRESRGAIAYLGLAGEMLRRERTPAAKTASQET